MADKNPADAAQQLGSQQQQALIKNHPFFHSLSAEAVAELARYLQEQKFRVGSVIVAQGELIDSIFFIAQGTAEVTRKMDLGGKTETVFIAALRENEAIGLTESGYFAPGGIRTATVTAATDTLLLRLQVSDFHRFLQAYPDFNQATQAATELMIRMNFIRDVTSFVQLSLGRIRWLAQHLDKIQVAKNTEIFQQGEIGEKCYLIYSGQVEISIAEPDGSKKILALLQAAQMFGETALFTASPRNATALATEDTVLFVIKRQDMLELTAMEDSTNQAIHHLMVERSRPQRALNIVDYHNTTADGEKIFTLKNVANSHYYRLNQEGWFIWQQVNGRNSLREITELFKQQFKGSQHKTVATTIFNLAKAGFIQIASLKLNSQDGQQSVLSSPRKWWSIIGLLIALLAGILWYLGFAGSSRSSTLSAPASMTVAPIVNLVLAVNIDDIKDITPESVQNGAVPILAIHIGSDPNVHQRDTVRFINEFAQLIFFDSDKNGRIDPSDPAFSRLELIFLSPDPAKVKHMPIINTGIRALDLNKAELLHYAMSNQPDKFKDVDNVVVMANGATRRMAIVAIDQNLLP